MTTEEDLNEMSEEFDVNVVYIEETKCIKTEGVGEVILSVWVYEVSKASEAKKLYDEYYSTISSDTSTSNPIDINEEGHSLFTSGRRVIVFRTGRFVVTVMGKASVWDIARMTEQNIKIATAPHHQQDQHLFTSLPFTYSLYKKILKT
jgi:hypothetical protein